MRELTLFVVTWVGQATKPEAFAMFKYKAGNPTRKLATFVKNRNLLQKGFPSSMAIIQLHKQSFKVSFDIVHP